MINKVNHNPIADLLRDAAARPAQSRPASVDSRADASLQVSYEPLIAQAGQEPVDNAAIVERARQMLLSGELDTPENIREAAKNMIKFGI
jgi:hypothetical protein